MISNVSAASTAAMEAVTQATTSGAQPATIAKKEDSVHLSAQAQASAARDLDHDGDSH